MSDAMPVSVTTLPRSGLKVSRLGFGTAALSGLYQPTPESDAIEAIQTALRQGITLFDTAPFYGTGLSETRLGIGLQGVPRQQYVISTKVGRTIQPDRKVSNSASNWQSGFDLSSDGVQRSLEGSLQRLNVDRVDIALVHDPDSAPDGYRAALREAIPALNRLKEQGVISAVGVGINQWEMLDNFLQDGDLDIVLLAGRYTLLEQSSAVFLDRCAERRVGVMLGGVFNSGILATGATPGAMYNYTPAPEAILDRVRALDTLCRRYSVSLKTAALQFPLRHSAVSSVVVGMGSPNEVQENIAALNADVPDALWRELGIGKATG